VGPTPTLTNPECMSPVAEWILETGPAGMTIDGAGVVNWPTPTIAGSPHTITIRATNAAGSDTATWTLAVETAAPVVGEIPDESIAEGAPYTGPTPALTDPTCMDPVEWSLVDFPAGM